MSTNRKVMITSDCHADIDLEKIKILKEKNVLMDKDYLIICGDFGALWYGDYRDSYVLNFYNECPWTTLFVDG